MLVVIPQPATATNRSRRVSNPHAPPQTQIPPSVARAGRSPPRSRRRRRLAAPDRRLRGAARAARLRDRDRTLDEIRDFGVTQVRQLVYWKDFAPRPNASASRRRSTPPTRRPTRPTRGTASTRSSRRAARAGSRCTSTSPGRCRGGPPRPARTTSPGRARRSSRRGRPRSGAATATRSRPGRSGTSPTSRSSCSRSTATGSPYSPGPLPARSTRPASRAQETASNRGDTFLLGETSPRGNSKVVFPLDFFRAHAVPERQLRKTKKCGVLDADGYAHHAYTTAKGPRFVPRDTRRRHARRALAARARARPRRQGRRAAARAAGLPDRVRHPVAAGPHPGRLVRQAGGVPRGRRAHDLRQPARALVLPVPDVRRPAARLGAEQVRRASRAGCARARATRSRPTRRSGFRSRSRTTAARTSSGASCARPEATAVRIEVDPRGNTRLAQARRRQDDRHGRLSLRATHRKGQRYRVSGPRRAGKRYAGAAVRAY